MKKFQPHESIFVGLLVVLPLLVFILVIKPRYDAQKEMSQMATSIDSTCTEFGDIRQTAVECLQSDKKALGELVEETRIRLPKEGDSGGILHGLAKMARENDLVLKDVAPVSRGPEKDSETHHQRYGSQRIDIELEGSFDALYNFLIALEDYERIIHIDTMILKLTESKSNNRNATADGRINTELGIVVYYEKISEDSEEPK
jgi:Tfp pilus assembly protein PilO